MNKVTLVFCLLFLSVSSVLFAQNSGIVKGKVIDSETGDAVPFAVVKIKGTTQAVNTDFDGNYIMKLPSGTYTLEVTFFGYAPYEIKGVVISSGSTIVKDANLGSDTKKLEEVVIVGERSTDNDAAVLQAQKESVNVSDAVTSESIKKTGDSNAAGAVKRVSGVSIQGGKYVYVRGLGDRYTKTMLNELPIPGLDPDRNSLQIDLFPTSIINNITVVKTFTADLPADFSGGLVDIKLKNLPKEKLFNVKVSTGYNPSMNLKNDFLTTEKGGLDFLGMDNGDRDAPFNINDPFTTVQGQQNTNDEANTYTNSFNSTLAAQTKTSFFNYGLGASYGNSKKVKNGNTLGYFASLTYKNKYTHYDDYQRLDHFKQNDKAESELLLGRSRRGTYSTQNVLLTALAGGGYKTAKSTYKISLLRVQNGSSKAGILDIFVPEYDGVDVPGRSNFDAIAHNLQYTAKAVNNLLISGSHIVPGKSIDIDWSLSPTISSIYDKDIRFTQFSKRSDGTFNINSATGDSPRIWRNLDERSYSGRLDVKKSFELNGKESDVKAGLSSTIKEREFELLLFNLNFFPTSPIFGEADPDLIYDNITSADNGNQGFFYTNATNANNSYDGRIINNAAYVTSNLTLSDKVKLISGLRMETYQQFFTGEDASGNEVVDEQVLDLVDFFPSLSTVYSPFESSNLRLSYGRTTARPSFKEKSSAQIFDPISGINFLGNLDLQPTYVNNFDIRWETYLKDAQFFAVSLFYKQFTDPIELLILDEADPDSYSPRNTDEAQVYGVEVEARKTLDFISPLMENFFLSFNGSLIRSRVKLSQEELASRRANARDGEDVDDFRSLQGQAPYLLNTTLSYENDSLGFSSSLSYNVQGKRLAIIGINVLPDVYEVPFHSLNWTLSKKLGAEKRSNLSFSISNILGDLKEFEWQSYKSNKIYSRVNPGREFKVSYSYKFF